MHTDTPAVPRERRATWPLIYGVAAVLILAIFGWDQYLGLQVNTSFANSIQADRQWAMRAGALSDLRKVASDANAPANDIFVTRDVAAERKRLYLAAAHFERVFSEANLLFGSHPVDAEREVMLSELMRAGEQMRRMIELAEQTLGRYSERQIEAATARMVEVDRTYARVQDSIRQVGQSARSLQKADFDAHTRTVERNRKLELASMVGVTALTLGMLIYGFHIRRQMEREATERARVAEELLAAKEAAEAANLAKSQFLANMSHEIRTPMNGVLGMTELLLGTALNDQQRRFADSAHRSGQALLGVINDILDFSKIESGTFEVESLPFNPCEVGYDVAELLAPQAHAKGLEVICQMGPDLPTRAFGDATRLRQVLTNLVGNAVKFTERGHVMITVNRLSGAAAHNHAALIEFVVSDSGIGISEIDQERVFEAFTQVDGSRTRRHGGTGLGLAISSQLVAMMGGKLQLDSTPGEGSRFWFSLPMRLANESTTALTDREASALNGLQVLVVDDNTVNLDILRHQLTVWGLRVDTASNAAHALDMLQHRAVLPDIALLDMHMPDMNGIALTEKIRANAKFDGLKLVMLSSAGLDMPSNGLARLGISRWLSKPVRKQELRRALLDLLASEPALTEVAPPTAPSSEAPTQLHAAQPAHVLLAEDHGLNQEVAEQMLQLAGYTVEIVADGRAALAAAQSGRFDVVLMDCLMPVMDGFEATAGLREWERERGVVKRLPIIALTANAMKGDVEACLAAGMDDYVAKPFTQEQLVRTIERQLRGSSHRPQNVPG